ncbi:hypothetical protein [Chloroflexus sp.]|uniref:hypothetical protein n=1 Tax=Chloroflexus sp. TaxID=1904827 RepID=UPI002ADE88A8|nr:hypothetical protein [Chloroflexus sp.]
MNSVHTVTYWNTWQKGLASVVFALLFVINLPTYTDPDLWGHLRFGLDHIQAGGLSWTDPYSYLNEGYPWINHEWLMETFMGFAWLWGGEIGLTVLRHFVYSLTVGILFWYIIRQFRAPFVPAVVISLILIATTLWFARVVRPQIFTFLLFACTLIIIDQAERGHFRWLWLMPLIVIFWVNLHGGFLAGCGVLGVWMLARFVTSPRQWQHVVPPVVVSAIATLVNPYGWNLLRFLLETATGDRPEIADWQPLPLRSEFGIIYLSVVTFAVAGLIFSRLPRRPIPIGLFILVSLMPLLAIRHLPLMGIAFVVFIGEHVVDAWQRLIGERQREVPVPGWLVPVPFVVAALILLIGIGRYDWRIAPALPVPEQAVQLLRQSDFRGHLLVDFGWGQYVIWHLGPQVQVGMDGRRETVYPPEVYDLYVQFHYGIDDWDAILERATADAVLVEKGSPPSNLLQLKEGWQLVFTDDISMLFINETSASAQVIARFADSFTPVESNKAFP